MNSLATARQTDSLRIVVVGGGAAGFFGAITCAETFPDAKVILLEASPQFLAKVRISGGGRCNVTHACFEPAHLVQYYPRGSKVLRGAFSRFQPRDTVQWFERRGVALKTEADGRMFPVTDSSRTIVNCLIEAAHTTGVELRAKSPAIAVTHSNSKFTVHLKEGEGAPQRLRCDRLLLATGSNSQGYRLAKTLGHQIVPPVPSLFTFQVRDRQLQALAGIAVPNVTLRLHSQSAKLEQTGALLITHWGLSGPAVLKLSAWGARVLHEAHYQADLSINWVPDSPVDTLRQHCMAMRNQNAKRRIYIDRPVPIPQRLWEYLCQRAGIDETTRWAELSKPALNQLLQELTQGQYLIQGKGVFKEEFVTCGGIRLQDVNFKTMVSRYCPGLYFAGEVLDIDGVTGGFNFQSAWTTGWLAGKAMGCPHTLP